MQLDRDFDKWHRFGERSVTTLSEAKKQTAVSIREKGEVERMENDTIGKMFPGYGSRQCCTIRFLPATEKQAESLLKIAQAVQNDPSHVVHIILGHDDPGEILFAWTGSGYRMVLSFPMDDWNWTHPLLLQGDALSYDDVAEILTGILLEERDTDSFPVIMNGFREISSAIFEGTKSGQVSDESEADFLCRLNRVLERFDEWGTLDSAEDVLIQIFHGIAAGAKLPVPVDENGDPYLISFSSGPLYLVAFSSEERESTKAYAMGDLIRMCEETEACCGMVFNPDNEDPFVLSLDLLRAAIETGHGPVSKRPAEEGSEQ